MIPQRKERGLFTRTEKMVLSRVFYFDSNRELAASMGISVNTVKTHLKNIFRKTGCHNYKSLLKYVLKNELELLLECI
ncbi:helix-turn-helix transcriptional regulator [Candidatus Riflebacteria bacterium]